MITYYAYVLAETYLGPYQASMMETLMITYYAYVLAETYLGPYEAAMMETFYENSYLQ